MISAIGLDAPVHPDFGSFLGYGIPYNVVSSKKVHKVHVSFDYADESDKVAYPMPAHPRQEGGGDAHVLIVDKTACRLYELYAAHESGGSWKAGSGAVWNLRSNHLRPDGWTSADAAGLPILPGLVRYDEVAAGVIRHALRFTASRTSEAHIYPARHDAGDSDGSLPPMGLRVRLKASVDISGYGEAGSRRPAGAQDLRDDPGRQRQPLVHLGREQQALRRRRPARARQDHRRGLRGRRHLAPAQRLTPGRPTLPRTGDTGDPRRKHDAHMGNLALAPAAVAFPVVVLPDLLPVRRAAARARC